MQPIQSNSLLIFARDALSPSNRGVDASDGLSNFIKYAATCHNIIVFSGSGLSATSGRGNAVSVSIIHVALNSRRCAEPIFWYAGMSMFTTRNGLYDRAKKQFKIQDGIKLFTYSFYKQRQEGGMIVGSVKKV
jgi:hypothetical protein